MQTDTAPIFTALADPTRRQIVELLSRGESSAGEIVEAFDVSGPAISQHLKVLREAALVQVRVDGQRRIYQLNPQGLSEMDDWLNNVRRFWAPKLDALERELRRPDKTEIKGERNQAMSADMVDNNAYGTVLESGAVRFERLLPGPVERVWEYITDSDKRATWLAAGKMDLRVGGAVTLEFRNGDLAPKGEAVPERYSKYIGPVTHRGHITQLEPLRLLAMTWNEKDGGADAGCSGNSSEVIFELTPKGKDVLLTLTHRRLATRGDMLGVSSGWHTHVAVLIERLNGRAPTEFWTSLDRLSPIYDKRMPD